MHGVTIKQKILLHLLSLDGQLYIRGHMPFESTQDGIAEAIGITRAHCSQVIVKLMQDGHVAAEKDHIKGSERRRATYRLTPDGRKTADELRRSLINMGFDPERIISSGTCTPEELWIKLNENDRNVFGLACTIDMPVQRSTLRPMTHDIMPVDQNGRVRIPKVMSQGYLQCVPEQKRIKWHSDAADYWYANSDPAERLKHLVLSNRFDEAVRLVSKSGASLMDSSSPALFSSLRVLESKRCIGSVLALQGSMALELGFTDDASEVADKMLDLGVPGWRTVKAEALRTRGWIREAFRMAKDEYSISRDGRAMLILAECCADLGDLEQASAYGWDSAEHAIRKADLKLFVDCLVALSRIYLLQGESEESLAMAKLAYANCSRSKRKRLDNIIRGQKTGSVDGVPAKGLKICNVKLTDIFDVPLQHREPLEPEPPCEDGRLDPEGGEDLGTEDAGTAEFQPLPVEEHLELKGGFGVGEIAGTDVDLVEPHTGVELPDEGDEHVQAGVLVDDDPLDLAELGKVGRIDGFLPEDAGDGEGLLRGVGMGGDVPDAGNRGVRPEKGL